MARIDKYEGVGDGFRAPLAADWAGSVTPIGVGLDGTNGCSCCSVRSWLCRILRASAFTGAVVAFSSATRAISIPSR